MFSEFTSKFQNLKWDPQSSGEPMQSSKEESGSRLSGRTENASILYQPLQPGPLGKRLGIWRRQLQIQINGWLNMPNYT